MCAETEAGAGYLGGHGHITCLCSDGARKAKAHLEFEASKASEGQQERVSP